MPTTNPTGGKGYRLAFDAYVADLERIARRMSIDDLLNAGTAAEWQSALNEYHAAIEAQLFEHITKSGNKALRDFDWPGGTDREAIERIFALDNPYAIAAARDRAAIYVRESDQATRDGIRALISDAFGGERRMEHKEIARRIAGYTKRDGTKVPGLIGNLTRDIRAAERHREKLLASGMRKDWVDKKVGRLSKRYLRRRGMNIARTELAFANESGKLTSWQLADQEGYVAPQAVRQWFTAWDERTCSICAPLHNTTAPLDGSFPNGSSGPPAHPSCRCSTSLTTIVPGSTRSLKTPPGEEAAKRQRNRNKRHTAERRAAFRQRFRNVPQEA